MPLIIEELPAAVLADVAYQNARKNSDKQNARIEHDKAAQRAAIARMNIETEFFKQFSDNESFRRAVLDTLFSLTYS
jgi:type I restriction enzyme R subunit